MPGQGHAAPRMQMSTTKTMMRSSLEGEYSKSGLASGRCVHPERGPVPNAGALRYCASGHCPRCGAHLRPWVRARNCATSAGATPTSPCSCMKATPFLGFWLNSATPCWNCRL